MKKQRIEEKTAKLVAKVATRTLKTEANSSSCGLIYQPKAPKELNHYKK